jgi:hypothetical protein
VAYSILRRWWDFPLLLDRGEEKGEESLKLVEFDPENDPHLNPLPRLLFFPYWRFAPISPSRREKDRRKTGRSGAGWRFQPAQARMYLCALTNTPLALTGVIIIRRLAIVSRLRCLTG